MPTDNLDVLCQNIYNKMTRFAKNLVKTGEDIAQEYGIPIVNKRISITPISIGWRYCMHILRMIMLKIAQTLDRVCRRIGSKLYRRIFCYCFERHDPNADELLIRFYS